MQVQTKEQHFIDLKETMGKVTDSINELEIKMINHKRLMNAIETIKRKTVLQLPKKNEVEVNEISNYQVEILERINIEAKSDSE